MGNASLPITDCERGVSNHWAAGTPALRGVTATTDAMEVRDPPFPPSHFALRQFESDATPLWWSTTRVACANYDRPHRRATSLWYRSTISSDGALVFVLAGERASYGDALAQRASASSGV